jgi:hypothetical protein
MKLTMRKLNSIAYIKLYCGIQNDRKRLSKLNNKLKFTKSIAAIAVAETRELTHYRQQIRLKLLQKTWMCQN